MWFYSDSIISCRLSPHFNLNLCSSVGFQRRPMSDIIQLAVILSQTRCLVSTVPPLQRSVSPRFISVRASRGASLRGPTWWWWPSQTETWWCRPGGSRPSTPAHSSCSGDSPGPGSPRSGQHFGLHVWTTRCQDLLLCWWLVMMSHICKTAGWTPTFIMFSCSFLSLLPSSCLAPSDEQHMHLFRCSVV